MTKRRPTKRSRKAKPPRARPAPNPLRHQIESLIAAIRVAGAPEKADRYASMFATLADHQLHFGHLDLLLCALDGRDYASEPLARPPTPPKPAPTRTRAPTPPPPEPPPPAAPDRLAPIEPFLPFLDAIPRGRDLLRELDALASTDEPRQVEAILRRVFCDHLGYRPSRIDQTPRMGSSSRYRRFVTLATHGRFAVSLLELGTRDWHASHYTRCFEIEPFGLVIALAPGVEAVRFVFRRLRGMSEARPWYRALTGRFRGREVDDNLLVWCRRLQELRPRFGDTETRLRDRVQAALQVPAADLAPRWPSEPFSLDDASPPGCSLDQSVARAADSFLQPGVEGERLHWGLHGALRSHFPVPLWGGKVRLRYLDYQLEGRAPATLDAWRSGTTRAVPILLRLACELDDGESKQLSLRCSLPVPDARGRFVLRGGLAHFAPRVDHAGRLGQRLLERAEGELDEDFLDELEGGATWRLEGDDTGPDDATDDAAGDATWSPTSFSGASLETFLGHAVERKLHGVLRYLMGSTWNQPCPEEDLVDQVRRLFIRWVDDEDRFCLAATGWLQAHLDPLDGPDDDQSGHVAALSDPPAGPQRPPAWACPDSALHRAPEAWLPVSGARLHPTGALAVPRRSAEGQALLAVESDDALAVNPRLGGEGAGPRAWWTHARLRPWAVLAPGSLSAAGEVLEHASALPNAEVVRSHGPRLLAWYRPGVLAGGRARTRQLHLDLPWHSAGQGEPDLLARPGERIWPGRLWASCPLDLWPNAEERRPSQLRKLLKRGLNADGESPLESWLERHAFHAPGWAEGTVVHAGRATITDRYGLPRGWRLTLEIALDAPRRRWLVLPDGRLAPLQQTTGSEMMPWREDGSTPDLWLELPEDDANTVMDMDEIWFSGETGLLLDGAAYSRGAFVLEGPASLVVQSGEHRHRRRLDLEPEAPPPPGPAVTPRELLRWLALDPYGYSKALSRSLDRKALPQGWVERLGEVLSTARLEAPAVMPDAWRAPLAARPTGARRVHDPMATAVRFANEERPVAKRPRPRSAWGCGCGYWRSEGEHRCTCPTCGDALTLRPVEQDGAKLWGLLLPEPVLHPWRLVSIAVLLGLLPDELTRLLASHGPAPVVQQIRETARDPLACGHARLALPTSHPRALSRERQRRLGAAIHVLRELARAGDLLDRLVIVHLPQLPVALQPNGLPVGTPALVGSPLTVAYRKVDAAAKRLRDMSRGASPTLRLAAQIALQDAVAGLFGRPDTGSGEDGGVDSLAGLLRRLLPWTRPPGLRQGWPGLVSIAGSPADPDEQGTETIWLPRPMRLPRNAGPAVPPVPDGPDPGEVGWAAGLVPEHRAVIEALPVTVLDRYRGYTFQRTEVDDEQLRAHLASLDAVWIINGLDHTELTEVLATLGHLSAGRARRFNATTLRRKLLAALGDAILGDDRDPHRDWRHEPLGVNIEPEPTHRTWVVLGASAEPLPTLHPLEPQPATHGAWEQRWARERLDRSLWPRMIALLSAFDAPSGPPLDLDGMGLPAPTPPAGLGALVATARLLTQATSDPGPLVELLCLDVPLMLPRRRSAAERALLDRLEPALPGEGPAARLARRAWVAALGCWWVGPPSNEHPLGWMRTMDEAGAPQGWRRAVPTRGGTAWLLWPGMRVVTDPLGFLADDASLEASWSPGLRLLFGTPFPLDPLPAWLTDDVDEGRDDVTRPAATADTPPDVQEAALPAPEPADAPPDDAPADDAGVGLLDTSIAAWLAARRGHHGR